MNNNNNDDRRWIERLKQIPQYRPVVDKLLQGWSPDAVTDWLMEQTDRGPFSGLSRSPVYYYLVTLNVQLKANSHERAEKEGTHQAQRPTQLADEFTSGTTPKADTAAKQPEPIDEESKVTETQNLNSKIGELTSDGIVRHFLEMQLPHVHRMAKWEKQHNMPHPGFERTMEVLIAGAKILQENESRDRRIATQSQADIPASEPQPSEETQRLAKLTELNRQRRREAGEEVKTQLKLRTKEAQVN